MLKPRYDRAHKLVPEAPAHRAWYGSLGMILCSLLLMPVIGTQFFPSGTRDQFFIKVWLPEGSPISKTADVARKVEKVLLDKSPVGEGKSKKERLSNVVTFIGSGGPRLMVTQEPEYPYPYYALLLVNTVDAEYTEEYASLMSDN